MNRSPLSPLRLNPDLLPKVEDIINKALEKDRSLRYQHASEMRADLLRLKRDTESGRKVLPSREQAGIDGSVRDQAQRSTEPAHLPPGTDVRSSRSAQILAARKPGNRIIGAVVLVAALLVASGLYWRLHRSVKLTDKDTVVIGEFTNTTGDPVFDGTLRQGLSSQLEQSPFLNLLSDEHVAQTLSLMSQPKDARLTRELAREVCQRTASAATIEGSISSLGSQYVVGLNAVNCHSGDLLAQEQVTASGKEQVLKALGEAATKLRGKLGESLASVQKYDAPAENVTTSSLEALQAYGLGYQAAIVKNDNAGAVSLFQHAISLDPNFAMAYARLGTVYSNLGETARAAESSAKAYELRERVSERERFYIVSHYQNFLTGDLQGTVRTMELWSKTYPRDPMPPSFLGGATYWQLGQYENALAAAKRAVVLNPASGLDYANVVGSYMYLYRLDEAKATAQEAHAHNLDNSYVNVYLYLTAFLQHDKPAMEREAAALMGKAGVEDLMLYFESDTAAFGGQFAKARELTRRAADSAQRADEKETAAYYEAEAALREGSVDNAGSARQGAQAALTLSNGRDVEALSGIALGLAGDASQSAKLTADLAKRFPEDTVVRFNYLPAIRAALALQASNAGKAIEALEAAAPYELGIPNVTFSFTLYPVYLRGQAYLMAHQGAAAVAEFQKILGHPGVVLNFPLGALAHLQIGRAYAMQGDSAKAKGAYQDFLALWKDADLDIPILKQAKAEYAKLQ